VDVPCPIKTNRDEFGHFLNKYQEVGCKEIRDSSFHRAFLRQDSAYTFLKRLIVQKDVYGIRIDSLLYEKEEIKSILKSQTK
jgi:hypothetical protein